MSYIVAKIKATQVYHGYDAERNLIINPIKAAGFIEKIIRLDRILSFTEDYIFLTCPHGTVQTWEYEGTLEDIKAQLRTLNAFPA